MLGVDVYVGFCFLGFLSFVLLLESVWGYG